MNIIEILLSKNAQKPTREFEIKRLSKIIGKPFIATVRALSYEELDGIQERAGENSIKARSMTILMAVSFEGSKLSEFKENAGVTTANEMVSRVFLPGEIKSLYNAVFDVSGFGVTDNVIEVVTDNATKDIKKS